MKVHLYTFKLTIYSTTDCTRISCDFIDYFSVNLCMSEHCALSWTSGLQDVEQPVICILSELLTSLAQVLLLEIVSWQQH